MSRCGKSPEPYSEDTREPGSARDLSFIAVCHFQAAIGNTVLLGGGFDPASVVFAPNDVVDVFDFAFAPS